MCFTRLCSPKQPGPGTTHYVDYQFEIFNETQNDVIVKLLEPYIYTEEHKLIDDEIKIDSVTFKIPPKRTIMFFEKGESDNYDFHLSCETGGVKPIWENIDYIMVADTICDKRIWCSENRWDRMCLDSDCLCNSYFFTLRIK